MSPTYIAQLEEALASGGTCSTFANLHKSGSLYYVEQRSRPCAMRLARSRITWACIQGHNQRHARVSWRCTSRPAATSSPACSIAMRERQNSSAASNWL